MNLSEIQLKLFRVYVKNLSYIDQYGEHIGDNLPTEEGDFSFINYLNVSGYTMNDVSRFLFTHNIIPIKIEEVSILLQAPDKKASR